MTVNYRDLIQATTAKMFNVRDELQNLSVEEIRKHQPKRNFSICCGNITGDINLSNIIRSAVIFGADKVFIIGRKSFDRRGMVGANNYIDIEFIGGMIDENTPDWDKGIEHILASKYTPKFVETGGKQMGTAITWGKPCFIFGNEGIGIPENIIEKYPGIDIITVPQYGVMRSLNVASCAAIVMSKFNDFLGY